MSRLVWLSAAWVIALAVLVACTEVGHPVVSGAIALFFAPMALLSSELGRAAVAKSRTAVRIMVVVPVSLLAAMTLWAVVQFPGGLGWYWLLPAMMAVVYLRWWHREVTTPPCNWRQG